MINFIQKYSLYLKNQCVEYSQSLYDADMERFNLHIAHFFHSVSSTQMKRVILLHCIDMTNSIRS